jgi:pimeloyl-ACP methyl ester carboxylesterase
MKRLEKVGYIEIGSGHFKIGNKLIEEMRSLEPWKGLKNIRIPIMFVHGSKDTYIPYEDSVKYSKLFNAKLETVKGADHGLHNGWKGEMTDRITVDWFVKWLK